MKAKWIKQITVFVLSAILAAGSGTAGLAYAEDTAVVTDDNAASDVTDDQTPQDAVSDGSSDTVISDDSGDSQDSSEEEFIPDEYYEPVQTNDISGWPQGEAIQASSGIVMDLDTGAFLYAKNIQRKLYPASITKILTALLTLEHASLDDTITCTSAVYDLDDNASNIALQEGEQISVRDALYALMLESANDAANALAVHISGSVSAFADLMNQKAQELGCTVSHFANPSGLPNDDHYTCARVFALIAAGAYDNENFRKLIATKEYEIKPTNMTADSRVFANHHKMIQTDSDYYDDVCTGGKTGFTESAWNTLVTFGEKDGKRLVCVLLHGNGAPQNYRETTDLLNYGFDQFTHIQADTQKAEITLADAMGVHYLGAGADLESPELSQKIAGIKGSGMVTVPAGTDKTAVKTAPFKGADGTNTLAGEYGTICGQPADIQPTEGAVYYTLGGWPVGSRCVSVSPVNLKLTSAWQVSASVTLKADEGETGDKQEAAQLTNEKVWQNVSSYVQNLDQRRLSFWETHKTAIILSVGTILLAVLLLILILLVRSTRNYRLRKKMHQAQEEARKREQEIEEKTTAEIEEELRQAMKKQ
ncbi:serine hydrolase [Porcincola intestinalis]|uniref:serine hydrolase n=1 Tax=Porcincola intestinalis TaxID=2606632 RepID=UPI002A834AB7|nr:serine hydrolase [Porcincola intestinalis]MDY4205749.1 serine hydrolase [Porcincola intestinalis]